MAKLGRSRVWREVVAPQDGSGTQEPTPGERYCASCGQPLNADGSAIERFGEVFCSEGHADEFVKAVRAARVQVAATAIEVQPAGEAAAPAVKQRDWKAVLGKALCWGAPLLALVLVLGGGGALASAASGLIHVLVLLACPLGMYFMMRSMSKMGHDDRGDKGGPK